MTAEVKSKRFEDDRNIYNAPCCDTAIGIHEDTTTCTCPNCGAWLVQNGVGLSLRARVYPTLPI